MVEFIIEFIAELFMEGAEEAAVSKRVPKWLRIVLFILLTLFYAAFIIGFAAMAILMKEESIWLRLLFAAISAICIVYVIQISKRVKRNLP